MKKNGVLLFLFVFCGCAWAQKNDTLVKTTFIRQSNLFFDVKENHLQEDSTLDLHYNYLATDFNGSMALPSADIVVEQKKTSALGFRFMVPSYRGHFYTQEDVTYYNSKNPYTRAFALVGQRQEQIMRMVHTQNLKRFNYAIKFNRYKCTGFYVKQLSITDNFISAFNYHSKSEKYKLNFYFLYNKVRHEENGGIQNEAAFRDSLYLENKQLLSVNLTNAKRATRNLEASLTQQFKIGKNGENYIFHTASIADDYFVYSDDSTSNNFYSFFYNDTKKTHDSTHVSKLTNEIGWTSSDKGQPDSTAFGESRLYISAKHEWAEVKQFGYDSVFNNVIVKLGAQVKIRSSLLSAKTEVVAYGPMQQNKQYLVNYMLPLKWKNSLLTASFLHEVRAQDYFFKRYSGNNFQWINDFGDTKYTQGQLKFSAFDGKLSIENTFRGFENYVYFDTASIMQYNQGKIGVDRTTLSGRLKFGHFHFNNALSYQFSSNEKIIRLPSYYTQSQLYYEGRLFKNNLRLQIGTQCTYYSKFLANAYIPALNMYHLQNKTYYGNYPFFDFFISAEIKPVRFFFKLDHINQGLTGGNYFLTPNMPMPDRAFKFGFTWLFWD